MKEKIRKLCILTGLVCLSGTGALCAQLDENPPDLSTTGNAGGVMSSGNYIMEFTLGELITETLSNGTFQLTQGFNQSESSGMDSDLGTSSPEDEFTAEELNVYPNPFQDLIHIAYAFDSNHEMDIAIYDITGKLMLKTKQNFSNGSKQFDLSAYNDGVYFIKVQHADSNKLKTFKIIKG